MTPELKLLRNKLSDLDALVEALELELGDYLAIAGAEEDFDDHREALIAAGFEVGASQKAIWETLDSIDADPNDHRHVVYNEARSRRGLAPIER